MNCEKIVRLLSAYVLDEIDLEKRKDVSNHLELCGSCKSESARVERTYKFIKTSPQLDTSAKRREVVVGAISRVDLTKEGNLKRYLLVISVAAVILLGISAFILWESIFPHRIKLVAEEIEGEVYALSSQKTDWELLSAQSIINEGSWITTEPNTLAKFQLKMHDKVLGTIYLSGSTLAKFAKDKENPRDILIFINKGAIYGELESLDDGKYTIVDGQNDIAIVKGGSFEVGLKYTMAIKRNISLPPSNINYNISYTNIPLQNVAENIAKKANRNIESSSKAVAVQRINFYSNSNTSETLLADFESSLRNQGLAMVKSGDGKLKIVSIIDESSNVLSQRLYVKMVKGVAEIYSKLSKRIIEPREEGSIDGEGYIATKKLGGDAIAQWKDIKPQTYLAGGNIPLPLEIALGQEGYTVSERKFSAIIGDTNVDITIPDIIAGEDEEIVVPIKVKMGKR